MVNHGLCIVEQILFGNLHVKQFAGLFADELPFERGKHLLELLIDIFGSELFVAGYEPFLQEGHGKLHFAVLVHQVRFSIGFEKLAAVSGKVVGDHVGQGLLVAFLIGNLVFAEYVVKEFLIVLGGFEYDYFADGHLEIAVHVGGDVLVNIEHRCQFGGVALAAVPGIEDNFVVNLLAKEFGGLVLAFEVEGSHDAVDDLYCAGILVYAAVLVKLHHHTLDDGALVGFLAGNLCAEALAQSLILVLKHLVAYGNGVVRQRHVFVELDVKSGCQTDFVFEGIVLVVKVDFLYFYRQGFAQHVEFVVAYILDYSVVDGVVQHLALCLFAETGLDLRGGYVTLAEAGDAGLATDFLEFVFYFLSIIGFFDADNELAFNVRSLVKCDVHNFDFYFYVCYFDYSG